MHHQLLRALALRAGVQVYDTNLVGWKLHPSGHLELRHASSTMRQWGEHAVAECGQLVLCPEVWAAEALGWFGLGGATQAGAAPGNDPDAAQSGDTTALTEDTQATLGTCNF